MNRCLIPNYDTLSPRSCGVSRRGCPAPRSTLLTYRAVVQDYIDRWRRPATDEFKDFRKLTCLAAAIERAAEKGHNHQRRIKRDSLNAAACTLSRSASRLKGSGDFKELITQVERLLNPLSGIGEVTIYDIATRIGAYLRFYPELVYLHAGTREGAKHLGFTRRGWIRRDELPAAFRRLKPYEIEDCLCIYKDALAGITNSRKAGHC